MGEVSLEKIREMESGTAIIIPVRDKEIVVANDEDVFRFFEKIERGEDINE